MIDEEGVGTMTETEIAVQGTILVPPALVLQPGTESSHGVSVDSLRSHQETLVFEEGLVEEVCMNVCMFLVFPLRFTMLIHR